MHYFRSAVLGLVTAIFLTAAGCDRPPEDPGEGRTVGGQRRPTSQFDLGPTDKSAQVDDFELRPGE
jgi:hypothetical protein